MSPRQSLPGRPGWPHHVARPGRHGAPCDRVLALHRSFLPDGGGGGIAARRRTAAAVGGGTLPQGAGSRKGETSRLETAVWRSVIRYYNLNGAYCETISLSGLDARTGSDYHDPVPRVQLFHAHGPAAERWVYAVAVCGRHGSAPIPVHGGDDVGLS